MSLLDTLRGFFTKALPTPSNVWTRIAGKSGRLGDKASPELLRSYRGIVHACVEAIAEDVAGVELEFYRKRGEEEERVYDQPVTSLIEHANLFMTQFSLIEITTQHLELTGNAYWYVGRGKRLGMPSEIWPLYPDTVKVASHPTEFISGYVYQPRGSGDQIPLKREEIIHFKYNDPDNLYYGIGPLQAAARDFDIYQSAQNLNFNLFKNGAMPAGIMSTDQPIAQDTYDRLMKKFSDTYQGDENAFKTMFLSHGFKYSAMTINPADLLLIEQMRMTQEDIRQIFKVPKTRLLSVDDVKFANFDGTERAYMRWNIVGKMKRLVGALNEFLLPMYGPMGEGHRFHFANPVPSDRKLDAEIAALQVDKVRTRNEIRADLGLDPVQGGDLLYAQFSDVVLGSQVNEEALRSLKEQKQMLEAQNRYLIERKASG